MLLQELLGLGPENSFLAAFRGVWLVPFPSGGFQMEKKKKKRKKKKEKKPWPCATSTVTITCHGLQVGTMPSIYRDPELVLTPMASAWP